MNIAAFFTENKKYVLIATGLVIVGGFAYWFRNYESQQQSNNASDEANQEAQDAQLAQELLASQTYSTGADSSGASTTTPTVDTGNNTVQQLVNSILNPGSTNATGTPGTNGATPLSPAPPQTFSQPVTYSTPQPVSSNPYQQSPLGVEGSSAPIGVQTVQQGTIAPGILKSIPLATSMVQ